MPTPSISELTTTTLVARSGEIADNVTVNTALLLRLKERGNIMLLDGGEEIYEELSYAENTNTGWYSGADALPVAAQNVLTSAVFQWKQLSTQIVYTGAEKLKNSGKAQVINLVKARVENAKASMLNSMQTALYSDGTGSGGKELTGLDLAIPTDPTTGTYGGINRADFSFWRPEVYDPASTPTATTIVGYMNTLYNRLVRGTDAPDLIPFGQTLYGTFEASQQQFQRFTNSKLAEAGFQSLKYKGADVLLENNACGDTEGFFINTRYLRLKVHKDRNMVPIDGANSTRAPVNQDAEVVILGWFGNLTCSNSSLQGRFIGD
jgi:hypothetical protein